MNGYATINEEEEDVKRLLSAIFSMILEEGKSRDDKSEERNQPSSTDKSSEKSGDTKSREDRKPKEGPMASAGIVPKLESVAKSEERKLILEEKTQSFEENVSKEEDVRAKKLSKEEKKQPSSMGKSPDEKSGDTKSGEDRRSKSKESPMTSVEPVPKFESKSGEKMLSLEEKKQSEEHVSKEGDVERAKKLSKEEKKQILKKKSSSFWQMLILILINILNYWDRLTVAGVLTAIQAFYDINDAQAGLLWSAYMISTTLIAPVWGFLGDRYNRKYLMTVGLVLWTCTVLLSTLVPKDVINTYVRRLKYLKQSSIYFVTTEAQERLAQVVFGHLAFVVLSFQMFWLFVSSRFVLGLGQACYLVVAPCVIADMFAGGRRSCMYMLFFFAAPLGGGLGHIIGGKVAAIMGQWTWGVRSTFVLGVICILLMVFFVEEPKRGAAEKEQGQLLNSLVATSYCDDIKSLTSNLTYIFSTAAYTANVFTLGALSWWTAVIIIHNEAHMMGLNSTHLLPSERKNKVDAIFGAITVAGGIVGIALGSILSMLLRYGVGPSKCVRTSRSDSIICGIGSLLGAPLVYFLLQSIPVDMIDAWIVMFFTTTAMCFCWPLIVNLLMDIIIPTQRCVAHSWQILVIHAFGDASSPFIIGMISDALRGDDSSPGAHFNSLLTSLYLADSSLVISAILFFCAAYTFAKDYRRFRRKMGVLDDNSKSKESDAPTYDSKELGAEKKMLATS